MPISSDSRLGRVVFPALLLGLFAGCLPEELPEGEEEALGSAVQAFGGAPGSQGGFVIVSGDDADDDGHCHGTACGGIYAAFLKRAVLESKTQGTGILAIGVNGSHAQKGLESWNDPANGGPGATITYAITTTAIASVDFSSYAVIYIPSWSGNTAGGLSAAQIGALNARQPEIAKFVNLQGGSLVALTQAHATGGWGFLPVPLTTIDTAFSQADPTPELVSIAPSVTGANLSHCCFHGVFTGPEGYSGLSVLAVHNEGGVHYRKPVILGGLGTVLTGELCNDGRDNDGDGDADGSDQDCWVCGDGDLDPSEGCDDGNKIEGDGCSAACAQECGPPQVTVTHAPTLWPPNHERQEVSLADCGIVAQDGCGEPIDLAAANAHITCVTSDEALNSLGDGHTDADIEIIDADTVALRAERQGHGDGRVYEIHFAVTDAAGNSASGTCSVSVPHSQSGQPAIDSGDAHQICTQP